ncbi:MAG: hypothetical protein J5659_03370 [Clostridia bacterium]|nr:hypothetical protein [Clostridia bacterium]
MKNPFKKQSIVDTLVNVGVGGAANVLIDYAITLLPAETQKTLEGTTTHIAKIAIGALGGSMAKNKYLRAATDGIAVVGVSNWVNELMTGEEKTTNNGGENTSGAPFIGTGRIRTGQRGFRRGVRGTGAVAFMGA